MSDLSEKLFRVIDKAMEGREFKDKAEMQAFMNQFVGANIDALAVSLLPAWNAHPAALA